MTAVAANGALRAINGLARIQSLILDGPVSVGADGGTLEIWDGLHAEEPEDDIVKVGEGVVQLTGFSDFANTIYVAEGEFSVRATLLASVLVNGGTLTGNGEVGELLALSGVVEPGINGDGVLTVIGHLDMANEATLKLNIESVARAVRSGSKVLSTSTARSSCWKELEPFLIGGGFLVIRNLGPADIVGTFDALPEGEEFEYSGRIFQVTYDADDAGDAAILYKASTLAETDLGVSVRALPASAAKGSTLGVTYEFFNLGPETAGFVTVTIAVRDGAHFESFEIPAPWTCEPPNGGQGGPLTCTREDWAPTGADDPVVVRVEFTLDGDIGDSVLFDLFMVYEGMDPDESNQTAHRFVDIVAPDPLPFKLRLPFLAKDGTN